MHCWQSSTAFLLTDAMKDVIAKGTGKDAKLSSPMAVAGKTGTTSNNYDYWFSGYTPYHTASIWMGYDNNTNFNSENTHKKHQILSRQRFVKSLENLPSKESATTTLAVIVSSLNILKKALFQNKLVILM